MKEQYVFLPARRNGIIFHVAAILLLLAVSGLGLWEASRASIGPTFLLYLLPTLAAVSLVPLLGYQAYALLRATYILERDGIRLHWGLRVEEIPMDAILWVRPAVELESPIHLPWYRPPGALLGTYNLSDGGRIEFLASTVGSLILIATPQRVYGVSPARPQDFLQTFRRFTEMGSLTPLTARSVYPTFLLARVWNTPPARWLLLTGLALGLILLAWVSLAIGGREQVFLGFGPDGQPRDLVPAVRLLLLPVLNGFIFMADLLLGLFFFRREGSNFTAYLLWGSGSLTSLLFLVAMFFILVTG